MWLFIDRTFLFARATFDSWLCNSSSSKSHLSRRNVVTAYCISRSIMKRNNELILSCTILALGTGFEYLSGSRSFYSNFVYEAEEEDYEPFEIDGLELG